MALSGALTGMPAHSGIQSASMDPDPPADVTWTPADLVSDRPKYVALADALSRDVASGRLRPGQRLPTHRALARALGVHVMTVSKGYAEAARRGLVEIGRAHV